MSTDLIEKIELPSGHQILLYPDPDAENPREWDNTGHMICSHGRYDLGDPDERKEFDLDEADSWDSLLDLVSEKHGELIKLPVHMLDHSGLAFSTTEFSDPWDSGQVGWIYVPISEIKDQFDDITDEVREQIMEGLRAEVKTYGTYINGECVRYELVDALGDSIDSCGGFYSTKEAEEAARENIPNEEE